MNRLAFLSILLAASLLLGGCISFGAGQPEAVPSKPAPTVAVPAEPACKGKTQRKVLVTAFPLRYPEQIRSGEYMGWAQTTGEELGHVLDRNDRLRVAMAAERFPFAEAEAAPAVERDAQGKPLIAAWAARENAQYVITGVFRDLGTASKWGMVPERQLVIEAYLYNGNNGALLARKEFSQQVLLDGRLPKSIAPGTQGFSGSRLGAAYNALVDDIARWTEDSIVCQPFALHVTRVEDRRLTLDFGRESGIEVGMGLMAAPAGKGKPVAVVKEVQAKSSVAEIPQQWHPPTVRVGDVLYVPGK